MLHDYIIAVKSQSYSLSVCDVGKVYKQQGLSFCSCSASSLPQSAQKSFYTISGETHWKKK